MPLCRGPKCALPVDRPYEHASEVADKLRAEADEHLISAQEHADELRVRASQHEQAAGRERQLDDFPLCSGHHEMLRVDVAGALIATRGAPAEIRDEVLARANVDLVRGLRYG